MFVPIPTLVQAELPRLDSSHAHSSNQTDYPTSDCYMTFSTRSHQKLY